MLTLLTFGRHALERLTHERQFSEKNSPLQVFVVLD